MDRGYVIDIEILLDFMEDNLREMSGFIISMVGMVFWDMG